MERQDQNAMIPFSFVYPLLDRNVDTQMITQITAALKRSLIYQPKLICRRMGWKKCHAKELLPAVHYICKHTRLRARARVMAFAGA